MRVWIVNYYIGNPDRASNPRYLQLAKHFMTKGWEVITFNANHIDMTKPLFERKQYGEFDYVHIRAPYYVGNGLKRMWSIFKFAWTLYRHVNDYEKPDVVLHNIHTPFDYPVLWAARKVKAKYVAEAWDVWPDVFVHLKLVSSRNPVMKLFYWIEKQLYYHADQLVFTFLGSRTYLAEKGWTTDTGGKINMARVHYINNGVDLEQFDKDKVDHARNDVDLSRKDIFKVVYMGSVNYANQVQNLIDAAALLQNDTNYHFFIYGDGAHREVLEKYVAEKCIRNVHFKEKRIPFCEVAWVVSQATVNVMTYEKGFGYMGVSSGKMFQYLAAGKPIVCNIKIAYDDVISDNDLGVAQNIETAEGFAQAIRNIAEQPSYRYQGMCDRVRKTAERFDYKVLAAEEIKVIEAALVS